MPRWRHVYTTMPFLRRWFLFFSKQVEFRLYGGAKKKTRGGRWDSIDVLCKAMGVVDCYFFFYARGGFLKV